MSNDNSTCGCDSKNIGIPTQERALCVPKEILIDARQRLIQGAARVSSGEYSMNKKMVMAYGVNGSGLDNGTSTIKKHDSYERYLARKTGRGVLREQSDASRADKPISGGKVKRFGLFKYCAC